MAVITYRNRRYSVQIPSRDQLVAELRVVREKGILSLPSLDLPVLTDLAVNLSGGFSVDPAVAIERLLREAISRLGDGKHGHAATRLFGLTPNTRNLGPGDRRKQAADKLGTMTAETFRTRHQAGMVRDVAGQILEIVAEAAKVDQGNQSDDAAVSDASTEAQNLSTASPESIIEKILAVRNEPPAPATTLMHRRWLLITLIAIAAVLAGSLAFLTVPKPGNPARSNTPAVGCASTLPTHPRGALVAVVIDAKVKSTPCWTQEIAPVAPGSTVRYLITYENLSNVQQNDVVIGTNLAPKVLLVPGSTKIYNHDFPHGVNAGTDNIASGGILIGNYAPKALGYVVFSVAFPGQYDAACGWSDIRSVGIAQPKGLTSYYNTVETEVYNHC